MNDDGCERCAARLRFENHVFLVTGDRYWGSGVNDPPRPDLKEMYAVLERLPRGSVLLHGNAKGADRMASAHWNKAVQGPQVLMPYFGWLRRRGGPARNEFMLRMLMLMRDAGASCHVLAFHRRLNESHGTAHMALIAEAQGFPVSLYPRPAE